MKGKILTVLSATALISILQQSTLFSSEGRAELIQNDTIYKKSGNSGNTEAGSSDSKAQDYNSSRSNKTASAQDYNSSRSNKTSRAQDYNSSRSNKTAAAQDYNSSRSNKTSRARDYNSSRSNKTASALSDLSGGETGGENLQRATNHNSTRSNRTNNQVKGVVLSVSPSFSSAPGKSTETGKYDFSGNGINGRFSADYYFGRFGVGITNGLTFRQVNNKAVNERLALLGYEPSAVELTSSPGQNFFLLAGPVFRAGNKIQFSLEGKGGLFLNNPGTVRAVSTSGTGDVINITGSNRVLKPGIISGITVSYNLPGSMSVGVAAGYAGNGNSVSQFDTKTRETTVKNFYSHQFYAGATISFRIQGRKIIHRDLAARTVGESPEEPGNRDEDDDEVKRDTIVFHAAKIEFRQNLDESRKSNEVFRGAENLNNSEMIFRGDFDGDAVPDILSASVEDAIMSLRKHRGKMGNLQSNPLYKSDSRTSVNPLFEGSSNSGANPLHTSSNNNNPLYSGGGKEVSNPLAGSEKRTNTNPLFETSGKEQNNPLFKSRAAMLTTGKVADIFFPFELDVETVPGGNLKSAVWLDCVPAGFKGNETRINTTRSNIKHIYRLTGGAGVFTAEAVVESGGIEYDAVITGTVRSINDGKKGMLGIIR